MRPTMTIPRLCLIVARGTNGVIGRDGDLPWRLPEDLKFFKRVTAGAPLIMGRKTWDSLPRKPLPGRANIVVSRNADFQAAGARVYPGIDVATAAAQSVAMVCGAGEVFVIGGAALYAAALPLADRLYITEVDAAPQGDVVFPVLDPESWTVREVMAKDADDNHAHAFKVMRWDRTA